MFIVFTGNGKGKTTAALGQILRGWGYGKKALMIQFIKGPWKSGEDYFMNKVKDQRGSIPGKLKSKLISDLDGFYGSEIKKTGLGFVGILGDKLPRSAHVRAAKNALDYFRKEFKSGKWDILVLDEVNVACGLKLIRPWEVLGIIKNLPPEKMVIFTGRNAPSAFIKKADLATEMNEIKHPFNKGKLAKIAVDF